MVRSFLSLHVQAPLEAVAAWAEGRTGGTGVYLVPDPPWTSLYHEALEAEEDPEAIRAFLRELSRLGQALAFLVLSEEDLLFLLAEGILRRPLSLKLRERLTLVGLVMVMALMVFAFWNDLSRIFANLG